MKLNFLATLAAVIEHGSFAAAAPHVNVTPSAVSLQIKQLEAYFGQPLFDRSGRSVRPTPFALQLSGTLGRALAEIETLRATDRLAPAGRVRLGITESALTTLLPRAFGYLQQHAPGIALTVRRGTTPSLLADLKADRLDAAVVIRPPSGGSRRLGWRLLLTESFVLVVPRELPAMGVRQALRSLPWIRLDRELVAGQMAARFVDSVLPGHRALVDVPAVEAIVAMVGHGLGVSMLPTLRGDMRDAYPVREIALPPHAPVRQMSLVRRGTDGDDRRLNMVEEALLDAARQVAGEASGS